MAHAVRGVSISTFLSEDRALKKLEIELYGAVFTLQLLRYSMFSVVNLSSSINRVEFSEERYKNEVATGLQFTSRERMFRVQAISSRAEMKTALAPCDSAFVSMVLILLLADCPAYFSS